MSGKEDGDARPGTEFSEAEDSVRGRTWSLQATSNVSQMLKPYPIKLLKDIICKYRPSPMSITRYAKDAHV